MRRSTTTGGGGGGGSGSGGGPRGPRGGGSGGSGETAGGGRGFFKNGSVFGTHGKKISRPTTSSESTQSSQKISRTLSFSHTSQFTQRTRNDSAVPQPSPERWAQTEANDNPHAATVTPTSSEPLPRSAISSEQVAAGAQASQRPASGSSSITSTAPYVNMLARPGTGYQSAGTGTGMNPPSFGPLQPPSPTLETITHQHIQETSSKRISTLDYLRKAHEGRVYWFNTLLFNKSDLQRMPYFESRKLARRATNYLLLGLSLPIILDLYSSTPTEFLRTLNALLVEFESFQQIHPPDGSSSSISRGRFPQMFKRATTTASKGRRASSAAEIGLPLGNDSFDSKTTSGSNSSGAGTAATSFPANDIDLLPGEEYTHLLTPSLPFDPDFYETFATLCDVLIDCYTKLMGLVSSPKECNPIVAEMFTKTDARVRKILVQGVVKEFEDTSRAGVKSEIAGIGKVVLGGLI